MQGDRRVFHGVLRRGVGGQGMNFLQVVIVFVKGLDQLVDQVGVQGGLTDHDVPNADGRHGLVDTAVDTRIQIDRRVGRIGGKDGIDFILGESDHADFVRGGQIENGARAGTDRPEPHVDGAVTQGIGTFGEGEPAVLVFVGGDVEGLEHGFGHEVGSAAGAARADVVADDLLDVGDPAVFQDDDLHEVRIHQGHGENVVFFTVELVHAVETGQGHIAHHLADDRFPLVGQLDVFHAGTGHLGDGLNILDILGPDLGHPAAVRVVDSAGAAGTDTDEGGLGHRRHRQQTKKENPCNDDAYPFHTRNLPH
ncbi:hypothetical protein DESC_730130 [Desulfosarcina cetonica]|nr:hypothetical protein DESC_730130 [Desulfosarcina cetonica]